MSFTSTTASLPDGNHISYMDSGPVEGSSTYTTIVMLHGTAFNSHVFDHLHALAPSYNLRLIAVQRRDYMGSTPYSSAELEDLCSGKKVFLDRLTILLGHLICHIIQAHGIPEPNTHRSEGGIALLGWSMGCATAMTLLSDSALFVQGQYEILRRFVVKLVFYDPPFSALGLDPIGGRGQPYPMLGQTLVEHYENFKRLVGSYFDNPDSWDGDPNQLDPRFATDRATTDSWSREQWETIFQPSIAGRCEYPMNAGAMQTTIHDMFQRAFVDENTVKNTFPDVAVVYFACWRSPKTLIWGYYQMKLVHKQRIDRKQFMRPLSFKVVKDANHFWHWDLPDDFLKALVDAVQARS